MSLVWKSEDEMRKELENIEKTRDYNIFGYDGHMLAATGEFEYKGMRYIVNVLRYYVLKHPKFGRVSNFVPIGHMRKSEYFANLEYPESMKEVVETVKLVREYSSDFLYNDSLHSYADDMDIDQQINEMHRIAKSDIDSLKELQLEIDKKFKELEEVQRKISAMKIYD